MADKEQRWMQELLAFDKSGDQRALHRLRLELKKIRALVELAQAHSGKRAGSHFSGLKKMFRHAGAIRDASSQIRFLEERHLLSGEHKDRQAKSIQVAADVFAAHIDRYRKSGKKASKRLKSDMRAIGAERIRRWYAREIIRTGILLFGTGNELHEGRKRIKTMLYLQKLLPPEITERIRLNTDYLDQLQEAIGQWHDAVVAMTGWEEENPAGKRAVQQECGDKEQRVRGLAGGFYKMAHLS